MSLRVCHLGKYYAPALGGIETHVRTLARAQASLGETVRVVCVDHNGSNRDGESSEWDDSVEVIRVRRRMTLRGLDICPGLVKTLRRVVQEGTDILHLHTPNPTMLFALLKARPSVPIVITHHSDVIRQKVLRQLLRPFERAVYDNAASIQTTSPQYIDGSPFLKQYADRVEVLPLGARLEPYLTPSQAAQSHARKLIERMGSPLWLAVGRLVYYKAIHVALQALVNVPGKLLVIGTGPLSGRLKRMAKELGVSDRVVWQDAATPDELVGSYLAATALWFPSNARSEAFGLVQVEAMASGCPVINAVIPGSGVHWVSRHQETGLSVPCNDPQRAAAAACQLLAHPSLREEFSAAVPASGLGQLRSFDAGPPKYRGVPAYAIAGETMADVEHRNGAILPLRSRGEFSTTKPSSSSGSVPAAVRAQADESIHAVGL